MSPTTSLRRHMHWLVPLACVLVVLASKIVAARFIARARQDAVRLAVAEMRLDLVDRVRALEGTMRSRRAEFSFLASASPLASLPGAVRAALPADALRLRAEAEATLRRYLEAHPEFERVIVRDAEGRPVVAVGRRASAAVAIPLEAAALEAAPGRLRFHAPLGDGDGDGDGGELLADVNPASLLASLAMGTGRAVLLDADGAPLAGTPDAAAHLREAGVPGQQAPARGYIAATVTLEPVGFQHPVRWTLARAEREEDLLAALGPVAERYRATLVLDALGMISVVLLGAVALRHVYDRGRLEEQAAQEARWRAMEERLHEADRLAAVGRMAATLAHEVRNPLEGMRNWLALAEDEAREAGATAALRSTGRVREGIDHLAEVVRRVLALAKPAEARVESLDLGDVVRDTLASVAGTRGFRGLHVEQRVDPALPRVRGDRVLLGQLLLNLLLNARDAMPDGGTVRVTLGRSGRDVVLEVADTGRGIAPDMMPRLFEPFSSGKGSSGLGLSLCDRVARVHGGRMEARNDEAGGAAFTFVMPAEGVEPPAVQELPA